LQRHVTQTLSDISEGIITAFAVNGEACPFYDYGEMIYSMYYVMQVRTGEEDKICHMLKPPVFGECDKCFIPKVMRKYKVKGSYEMRRLILFPGYVFVATDDVKQLFFRLKQVPSLTKLLRDDDYFYPVSNNEMDKLISLMNDNYTVNMSYGYKEGSEVVITSGPMVGMQGAIKKIDRHHRTAWLQVEMFGRVTEIQIGLELVGVGEMSERILADSWQDLLFKRSKKYKGS